MGGYFVIYGHLSIGTLIGFVALLLNISNAANYIASVVPELLQAVGGHQRGEEFLMKAEMEAPPVTPCSNSSA